MAYLSVKAAKRSRGQCGLMLWSTAVAVTEYHRQGVLQPRGRQSSQFWRLWSPSSRHWLSSVWRAPASQFTPPGSPCVPPERGAHRRQGEVSECCRVSFKRALIPFIRCFSHGLTTSQRPPLPVPPPWGNRFQHRNCRGTHSLRNTWCGRHCWVSHIIHFPFFLGCRASIVSQAHWSRTEGYTSQPSLLLPGLQPTVEPSDQTVAPEKEAKVWRGAPWGFLGLHSTFSPSCCLVALHQRVTLKMEAVLQREGSWVADDFVERLHQDWETHIWSSFTWKDFPPSLGRGYQQPIAIPNSHSWAAV